MKQQVNVTKGEMQKSSSWWLYLFAFIIAALILNSIFYIQEAGGSHLRADTWRHIKYIISLLEHGAPISTLWENHHSRPLYHVLQILNLKFFNFNMLFDAYLGLIARIGIFLIFVRIFYSHSRRFGLFELLFLLIIAFLLLGFNKATPYTFPAVSVLSFDLLIVLVLFLQLDQIVSHKATSSQYFLILLTTMILILANADLGFLFIIPSIFVTLAIGLYKQKYNILIFSIFLFIFVGTYRFVISIFTPQSYSTAKLLSLVKNNISTDYLIDIIRGYGIGVLSGVVDATGFYNMGGTISLVIKLLSFVSVVALLIVVVLYFYMGLWNKTVIPLYIIAGWGLFILGAFVFRYDRGGFWIVAAARYSVVHAFGALGLLWAAWLIAGSMPKDGYRIISKVGLVAGILVLLVHAYQIYAAWDRAPFYNFWHHKSEVGIFLQAHDEENNIILPSYIVGKNRDSLEIAKYLKHNQLNIFSKKHGSSQKLIFLISSMEKYNIGKDIGCNNIIIEKSIKNICPFSKLSIDADINKCVVNNYDNRTFYVKAEIQSRGYVNNCIHIEQQSERLRYDVYEGKQIYYMKLEPGSMLTFYRREKIDAISLSLRVLN